MSKRLLPTILLAVLLAPTTAAVASPSTVAEAEELLADLRYDDAHATLEAGLSDGENDRESLAAIYMMLGEIAASNGQGDEARSLFRNALALVPELSLSEGASPKLAEPFEEARAALEMRDPVSASSELDGQQIVVSVDSDPVNMVVGATARLQVDDGEQVLEGRGRKRIVIDLPEGAEVLEVSLIDRHGNTLGPVSGETIDLEPAEQEITAESDDGPSLWRRWQLWGGLAVAFAAGGAYAGWSAQKKVDEIEALEDGTEFSVALELEDQASQRALYANVAFAAAGACLITGAILYWRDKDMEDAAASARGPAIAPMAGPSSVGVAASVRF